jgi:hypothetical protein
LLKLEIAIGGHQNFKTRISGNAEQLSVLESSHPRCWTVLTL